MSEYEKLRPWTDITYCECEQVQQLLLIYRLHDNPLHCYHCEGVVDPETIQLSEELVSDIANWHKVFSSLYKLWMDAGEYESWAREQMLNRDGQVNRQALRLTNHLNAVVPTYYWWWQDPDEEEFLTCPNCDGPIDYQSKFGTGECQQCRIIA